MGKIAQKKTKRRREHEKRARSRARAIATYDDTVRRGYTDLAERYEAAAPADRRAIEARMAALVDVAAADPARVAAAAVVARNITAAPIGRDHTAGTATAPDEYPHLYALVGRVLVGLRAMVPDACPHLSVNAPLAAVCVDEPNTVMCIACIETHVADAHDQVWEHQCSECGSVDLRGINPVMPTPTVGLPVRVGGEVQVFIPPVMLIGLGVCNPCRLAVGKKRARGGGAS